MFLRFYHSYHYLNLTFRSFSVLLSSQHALLPIVSIDVVYVESLQIFRNYWSIEWLITFVALSRSVISRMNLSVGEVEIYRSVLTVKRSVFKIGDDILNSQT